MPTTITYDDLLPMTLKQASEEYFRGSVSYGKLRALAKAGQFPVRVIGGRYFTRRDMIDEWFAQKQADTRKPGLRVVGK